MSAQTDRQRPKIKRIAKPLSWSLERQGSKQARKFPQTSNLLTERDEKYEALKASIFRKLKIPKKTLKLPKKEKKQLLTITLPTGQSIQVTERVAKIVSNVPKSVRTYLIDQFQIEGKNFPGYYSTIFLINGIDPVLATSRIPSGVKTIILSWKKQPDFEEFNSVILLNTREIINVTNAPPEVKYLPFAEYIQQNFNPIRRTKTAFIGPKTPSQQVPILDQIQTQNTTKSISTNYKVFWPPKMYPSVDLTRKIIKQPLAFDPPQTPALKSIWRNSMKRNSKSIAGFKRIRPETIHDRPVYSKTISERDIDIPYLTSRASFRKLILPYTPNPKIEKSQKLVSTPDPKSTQTPNTKSVSKTPELKLKEVKMMF